MKRRSFLKRLSLVVAAVTTGAAALPSAVKAAAPVPFNPANYAGIQWVTDPFPMRFDHDGLNWVHVPMFIEHKPRHARFNPAFTDAPYEVKLGRRGKKEFFAAMFERPKIDMKTTCSSS